ncbi:malate dehydrogenase (quinone) [Pelistega sp. NLN82]|uniref:Probable malate:quinone oxidoreductase n=1 Tax=Pelistega ratti TaxID=2652177 RepID=A0A6L9Y474_9BURK|nr:malate dehydrogenase (quinone) [Pelistega ratti]NEN74767.1 malate dehydrogenase (quinone) [Pelistega ratti]
MKKFLTSIFSLFILFIIAAIIFLKWPLHKTSIPPAENEEAVDVVMVGGGIMSMTLATYLQELAPDWQIHVFERLDQVALESSNGWNNAGTGHSAFAELNYTPMVNGEVPTTRAVNIAEQFEVSRQFWAYQVQQGVLGNPRDFINPTPHMSLVWGDENIAFLKKRYDALIKNPLFYGMEFSTDQEKIKEWAPLTMEGRDPNQKVAATYMPLGNDVNFGVITTQLAANLQKKDSFHLHLKHEVRGLEQNEDKTWNVAVYDLNTNTQKTIKAKFVFIGAGGAALKMLQLSGIPEAKNYAGFPVGGQFLYFEEPEIANRHHAKVYGQAETGAPPMSVPHLDSRYLDGKRAILFGPFALYSTKFLKSGSWFDLFSSMNTDNILGMLTVGIHNLDLVKYLVEQNTLSMDDRQAELIRYYPNAKQADWKLITAGQRVQIIKKREDGSSVLQFGTEVVVDQDRTLAALLGASPGASTSPPIMLKLMEQVFPAQMKQDWAEKIKTIIPSYGQKINSSAELTNQIRRMTSDILQLPYIDVPTHLGQEPVVEPTPTSATPSRNLNNEMQAP